MHVSKINTEEKGQKFSLEKWKYAWSKQSYLHADTRQMCTIYK